ncbi:nucleotidyltransferase [Desulfogranum mediterraneum]|uniref:nucleotidyltransferase n=1 Tax=Desulfogranum mediterraneum TaxID=160661 RepID=UPI0003FFC036|nr:nucleotidyltransferase [Desulfogranum mediterraneum]
MRKVNLNSKLRSWVKANVSLKEEDRNFVTAVYAAFKRVLNNKCIQIGSYPRFTAIRPLHDLDILFFLDSWNEESHDPSDKLNELYERIEDELENPTPYDLNVSLQTHSVSVSFSQSGQEVFAVDVVPAYSYGTNEFGQDTYMVPELIKRKRGDSRRALYESLANEERTMQWIATDPRGYIEVAKNVNQANSDFRRTVKLAKAWKHACKALNDNFPLKSFHIEQIITIFFQNNNDVEIFDAIFDFFITLPGRIEYPQIRDRGDNSKFIDSYLSDLSIEERNLVIEARDHFLKRLEEISDAESIDTLFNASFYRRVSSSEEFLFDQAIPTLTDNDFSFQIKGHVQPRDGSFRRFILDLIGSISIDRKIQFRIDGTPPQVDLFKWKVRNADHSPQPRGEITDHHTKNDPEHTKYVGEHYVECFAILNNVCVAKAKQNVKLGS